MGFGECGAKGKIWEVDDGFGWWRTAGGGVLVVGKVAVGGGCGWFWIYGGEGRRWDGEWVYGARKMREREGEM
jgi:hypothetical protein